MFEGNSADMCAGKFPVVSMGGRADGLACVDTGARTPIGASGFVLLILHPCIFLNSMTFEGLLMRFEGGFGDPNSEFFLLLCMGAEHCCACADTGARTPIRASVNFLIKS